MLTANAEVLAVAKPRGLLLMLGRHVEHRALSDLSPPDSDFHSMVDHVQGQPVLEVIGTGMEHGCNKIVAIGGFMSYIPAMNTVLFALPFVVALVFAALTYHQEMR